MIPAIAAERPLGDSSSCGTVEVVRPRNKRGKWRSPEAARTTLDCRLTRVESDLVSEDAAPDVDRDHEYHCYS